MGRQLRSHTTVSAVKLVPRTVGRAYFNVGLGIALLAFLIWGAATGGSSFDTRIVVEYVVAFLIIVAFIPRSVYGLIILRREARRASADRRGT